MIKASEQNSNFRANPLLKNIPVKYRETSTGSKRKTTSELGENYQLKINLESIHYSGKDYGYGWTFVISTLKRHWITNRVQIKRGRESIVNKKIYHNVVETSFYNLQHLPITICAQHISGFKLETTFRLQPNSFRRNLSPKSIYTNVSEAHDGFQFHELHSVAHEDAQFMFVLNFEVIPNETLGSKN